MEAEDPFRIAMVKVKVEKSKLLYMFSTNADQCFKMRHYLAKGSIKVSFSKDREGLNLVATGSCEPFKTTHFDLRADNSSGNLKT